MSKYVVYAIVITMLVIAGFAGYRLVYIPHAADTPAELAAKYQCPMHPAFVSEKPGECSICGMNLVPVKTEEAQSVAPPAPAKKKVMYKSTMMPKEISDKPGKDSMGMEMVPFEVEEKQAGGVEGLAPVTVSAGQQQLIGVRTEPVQYRELDKVIRTAGRIAYDPDLYSAETEYLGTLKAKERVKDSPLPDAAESAASLVKSSRMKLQLMGLSREQIEELGKKGSVPDNLLIGGRNGKLWLYAQIFDYESGQVKKGQVIKFSSKSFPGKTFRAEIEAIDAVLNTETRTLRVRAQFDNGEGLLRPNTFVNAEINISLGRQLSVPRDAVMDTGTRQIVYVDKGDGHFEPREIKTGEETDDYYQVLSGLSEGEKVVTSANFLVDSESRLKSAISNFK